MRDYARLDALLDQATADLYPDAPSSEHTAITEGVITMLAGRHIVRRGMRVLDIGSGCGIGAKLLRDAGCDVVTADAAPGIADVQADQSFLPFAAEFDLIWARHVLEHSVVPLLTLYEIARVLRPGGHAYIEVPAPDTDAAHETNKNHYSVLGVRAWSALMQRAFTIVDRWEYRFAIPQGDGRRIEDKYFGFMLQKEQST